MAKKDSDVFICMLEGGDYWAYPSPFVAHRRGAQIQFRNLTGDTIEIDFGTAPVHEKRLKLAPDKKGVVTVNGNAPPGLHSTGRRSSWRRYLLRPGVRRSEGAARHCGRMARLRRSARRGPFSCGAARRPRSSSTRRLHGPRVPFDLEVLHPKGLVSA